MHSFTLFSALAGASLVLAKPLAAPVAAPLITPAPFPKPVNRALERRYTSSEPTECQIKADAIISAAPGIYLEDYLVEWLNERQKKHTMDVWATNDISEVCSVNFPSSIDAPASISSAYSSYMSASASWASKMQPIITSVADFCGGAESAALEMLLVSNFDSCTSLYGAYMAEASKLAATADIETGTASSTATARQGPSSSTVLPPTGTASSSSESGEPEATDASKSSAVNDAPASSSTSTGGAARETGYVAAAAAAVMAVAGAMVAL